MQRTAEITRETAETQIRLKVNLDGTGKNQISTGIGFFDHMLNLLSRHALIDLEVDAKGDLEVDFHHTVEDTGIVLGTAVREALGSKLGIRRYGWCYLPMDESLTRVALDLGGRPYLVFQTPENQVIDQIGGQFPFSLVEEFFRAFAFNVGANLHTSILYGRDAHHMAEAAFKGLAKTLSQAVSIDPRIEGVMSTKETI